MPRGRPKGSITKVKDRPKRELDPHDITSVAGKRPDKVYRLVAKDDAHMARAELKGYGVTKRDENPDIKAPFIDRNPGDNTFGNREVVLMEADKKQVRARQAEGARLRGSAIKREHETRVEELLKDEMVSPQQAEEMLREGFVQRGVD